MVLAVGCAPTSLEGVDLPPASLPAEFEPSPVSVSFQHRFAPGTWDAGPHSYRLQLVCPETVGDPLDTGDLRFVINGRTRPLPGPVYLRLSGPSSTLTGSRDVVNISRDNETVAAVTLVGLVDSQLGEVAQCIGTVTVDSVGYELMAQEPVRP